MPPADSSPILTQVVRGERSGLAERQEPLVGLFPDVLDALRSELAGCAARLARLESRERRQQHRSAPGDRVARGRIAGETVRCA
jgi:hypothetical protein